MVFTKRLREGIRRGRIRCSIRIWTHPHVKVHGRYQMDDGHIVVDSIATIDIGDITDDLAQESGFENAEDLLRIAKHGRGDNVYLIRFHYLPPGAWDGPRWRHKISGLETSGGAVDDSRRIPARLPAIERRSRSRTNHPRRDKDG